MDLAAGRNTGNRVGLSDGSSHGRWAPEAVARFEDLEIQGCSLATERRPQVKRIRPCVCEPLPIQIAELSVFGSLRHTCTDDSTEWTLIDFAWPRKIGNEQGTVVFRQDTQRESRQYLERGVAQGIIAQRCSRSAGKFQGGVSAHADPALRRTSQPTEVQPGFGARVYPAFRISQHFERCWPVFG
jgi:hypothetical protein